MHNELRYQAKTHTISGKAIKRKKKVEKNNTEKQQGHAYGKGNNI